MKRLNLIKNQLISSVKDRKIISSSLDYFGFDDFLTEDEKTYRNKFRQYLQEHITPKMHEYTEKSEFPLDLVKSLVNNFPGILGMFLKGYGSLGCSYYLSCAILLELGQCDLSLATFFIIEGGMLLMKTINDLGSEGQKKKYLPLMNNCEVLASFCLTEPEFGSDAANIRTTAEELEDGSFVINGKKRWIGNAKIGHILIVWAVNKKNKNIEGYIVETDRQGVKIEEMIGKLSVKSMSNSEVTFENVKIPKENLLEKTRLMKNSANQMLYTSRVAVAWIATGACIAASDRVIEYANKRIQFGKPISSFQLVQSKLAIIMGNVQSMLYFCKRAGDLYVNGRLSMGQASLVKAWTTSKARETIRLAREIMGGNGILTSNWVMRALMDMESLHTYEGTYDINMLLCAKELTGISSFK